MTDLIKAIKYGQQKAKGGKVDITPELIRESKWIERLNEVHRWMIAGELNHVFFDIEELIEQCPNKGVRNFFKGFFDEWNKMLAERLDLVAQDYYDVRMYTLFEQAEAMVDSYDGVRKLIDILEWYITH